MSETTDPTKTAMVFEFYVRRIWPIHRHLARGQYSRRCQNCAASEKMVKLFSDGICELCHEFKSRQQPVTHQRNTQSAQELHDLLGKYQGQGKSQYDALVMFSGGKDSTYLIERIKREYPGLRMLAFTVDNGFMSPIAKKNIDNLLPKLNIDHIFIRPHRDFYVRLFRYAITHLNQQGSYGTVDFSDGEFMLDTARSLAAEKNIPLILCGYSRYQVENGLGLQSLESPPEIERKTRTHTAGLKLSDIFESADLAHWWHGQIYHESQIPRLIFPLYAWDLEEDEIKQKVVEWGLISPKSQSPIVTNHQLIPVLGVVDVHKFGYSSFENEFCRMIREGKADRWQWQMTFEFLEYTSRTGLFVRPVVEQLLARLGLTVEQVGVRF